MSSGARSTRGVRQLDAVVPDAGNRQGLIAVRSLGRAGVRVGAFDVLPDAPAYHSRWAASTGVLPDFAADPATFAASVRELVERSGARVVLAGYDGSIEALRERRSEVEPLATLALASEEALAVAVDKRRTFAIADEIGVAKPRSVVIRSADDVDAAGDETGFPAVIKPLRSWVQRSSDGERLLSKLVVNRDEARAGVEELLAAGGAVVLQEWASGRREAVWLMRAGGRVAARFVQVAHRVYPLLGGSSVLRESIDPPADVTEAAERLTEHIGLEGFSEVEFRRNTAGQALLMEINPRLSASVELAVRAGIDFPLHIYLWAAGEEVPTVREYRRGVRMRWFGGDLLRLRETLRTHGRPETEQPLAALGHFFADSLRPTGYDYLGWSDRRPVANATVGFFRTAWTAHRRKRNRTSEARRIA